MKNRTAFLARLNFIIDYALSVSIEIITW